MWSQINIKNANALKILRSFTALLYISIGIKFLLRPPINNPYAVYGSNIISIFCLLFAFFAIAPMPPTLHSKIKSISKISILTSIGLLIILHAYLFNTFGLKQTISCILMSFVSNALIQTPVMLLAEKVKAHEET